MGSMGLVIGVSALGASYVRIGSVGPSAADSSTTPSVLAVITLLSVLASFAGVATLRALPVRSSLLGFSFLLVGAELAGDERRESQE